MEWWSTVFGAGTLAAGLVTGCRQADNQRTCDGPDCDPTTVVVEVQEKPCPQQTHFCAPYIGGGWDSVVLWEGLEGHEPTACPDAAAGMSFKGRVLIPPDPDTVTPLYYAVGCGFADGGSCADDADDGSDFVCAPKIQDWPACVVANSHRDCPPDYYTAQKIVGSSTFHDLEWTVCCPGAGSGSGDGSGPTP